MNHQNNNPIKTSSQLASKPNGSNGVKCYIKTETFRILKVNYTPEMNDICEEIKYNLKGAEGGDGISLDFLKDNILEAEALGITEIDENLTLDEIKNKIVDLEKNIIIKEIVANLEYSKKGDASSFNILQSIINKAEDLGITDIDKNLSLEEIITTMPDLEKNVICSQIKDCLEDANKGSIDGFENLKLLVIKAKNLGITDIDKNLSLEEIITTMPDLEKNVICSQIKDCLEDANKGSLGGLEGLKYWIIQAENLGIIEIDKELSMDQVKSTILDLEKNFTQAIKSFLNEISGIITST